MSDMRCLVCGKGFKDGDKVIPVLRYVTNAKRGDFVGSTPVEHIHLRHLRNDPST